MTTPHALRVRSAAIPLHLGQPALEPVRLSGRESLNRVFEYELLLKTPDALNLGASGAADFDLDAFIGRELSCFIELDGAGEFVASAVGASVDRVGAGVREINALITDASLWGEEGRHVQYRLVLRPWLHLASLSTDCKIFQNKTVVEILDELLADYPFPVDKRLVETYPARDYQTQYNESDLSFFERLCQEWGINYFFEHSEGKHRLVLIDNLGGHQKNPSAAYQQVEYHAPGWKIDAEYLHAFIPHHQLTSGRYSTRDYDYILTGTDKPPATAIVDKGYRGVEIEGVRILRSGQRRGVTKTVKAMIKRRSAIESAIGHMKMDERLGRNPLKGALGDALHAVMCGSGHNLRLILAALRLYCARFGLAMPALIAALLAAPVKHRPACDWERNCSGRTTEFPNSQGQMQETPEGWTRRLT